MYAVVFILARLLETTSTLRCCANMPVAAMLRDLMAVFLLLSLSWFGSAAGASGELAEVADHIPDAFVLAVDEARERFVRPLHLDHPRDLDDRLDVRGFERALDDGRLVAGA